MKAVEKFIKLYNYCKPISEIVSCNTVDYAIFKNDNNIRFCNSYECLAQIPAGNEKIISKIREFINVNPYFWMIPLKTIDDKIFAFVLKSYHQREYRNVINSNCISYFYGWQEFKNYSSDKPIILVEGIKDAIVMKTIYPYVLATLKNGLSEDELIIFKNITSKIILCYDNDTPGKKSKINDAEKLNNIGVKTVFTNYAVHVKDPGECFNNKHLYDIMKNDILMQLNNI